MFLHLGSSFIPPGVWLPPFWKPLYKLYQIAVVNNELFMLSSISWCTLFLYEALLKLKHLGKKHSNSHSTWQVMFVKEN